MILTNAIISLCHLALGSEASPNPSLQPSFENRQDFDDASQGFIAPLLDGGVIKNETGAVIWDVNRYAFLEGEAPSSVNPSLWRQGQLLIKTGLFRVTEGVYQVRGADLSNMTIIEGKKGIIVVDPLISIETARSALALYYQHRPQKPLSAILYTHSHIDHFGGVRGLIKPEEVGKIAIIAPQGFVEAALSENVMAGNVMARRASYMYGSLLDPGVEGQVTAGLGLATSTGRTSLLLPTHLIQKSGETLKIDGVKFVFLMAPDSEAPAEMLFYLPDHKALCAAEDATHTMHNLYSLRGAKVRNARLWAGYLNEAIERFGAKSEVVFAQHHWPIWGQSRLIDFLEKQRDLYKYIHDQSLRLANQGYTMIEVGEKLTLPASLSEEWYNRGYYGSLNHNAKSVYDFYLGWFDGNPSTLHQLPPVPASVKYVEYMGGAQRVLEQAQKDFASGEYRWVAQVLNHLVFAQPGNQQAKELLAQTLEELGFTCENATWRNFYLTGAKELREGVKQGSSTILISPDMIEALPTPSLFDYLAVRLDGLRAADHPLSFYIELPDLKEDYLIEIKNGVLNFYPRKPPANSALIRINRADLNDIILKTVSLKQALAEKKLHIEGDRELFAEFLSLFDPFPQWFNIVEPN